MKKCIACGTFCNPNSPDEGAVGKCNTSYQWDGLIAIVRAYFYY